MKQKTKLSLIGAILNIAAWNLGLYLFVWFGSPPSPVENYGIIAGWGLALYAAGLYRTPLLAAPLCALIYLPWPVVSALVGNPTARNLPRTGFALVLLGRALVFASPIAVNWIVQLTVKRTPWFNRGEATRIY
jgi:hypothetical protein